MNLSPVQAFDAWIAALKSGQYQQCQGALCKLVDGQPRYCCLGVACDVMYHAEGPEAINVYRDTNEVYYDGEQSCLPTAVRDWLNMKSFTGCASFDEQPAGVPATACHRIDLDGHVTVTLVGLNDRGGWTFDQIADFLATHREKFLVQA